MEKHCISVDWLQTYCLGNQINDCEIEVCGMLMKVRLSDYETPQFKRHYKVLRNETIFAEIQQEPRTRVINKKATLVKLSNRVLYSRQYIKILYGIQEQLKLTFKGITRIDLCYDCQKFNNGRSPSKFINAFVSKDVGQSGYIYRNRSDKFAAYGSKSRTSKAKISSIRFGSEKSRIGAYIYNKTLELKEVKDKPYIREMWLENGMESSDENPVFRSEISIKAEGTDLLNMSTGQLFRLSPEYLEHADQVSRLFHIYAHKYFDFRVCNGQKNRRNYDKLYLFEESPAITVKPIYISTSADTGRMEKICYNKLEKLSKEYSDIAEIERDGVYKAMEFLKMLSGVKYSIVQAEKYKCYLDSLLGCKRISDLQKHYLSVIQECHIQSIAFDSSLLFSAYKSAGMMSDDEYVTKDLDDLSYLFT